MKIALVTLSDGDHCRQLAEIVSPAKREYCKRFGYDFIEFDRTLDPNRPTAWCKILAVLQVLPNYDWVLWNDADALVWDSGLGLKRFIADLNEELFVVQDDPVGINTGVFLVKNSPKIFELLARAYDQTQFNEHILWEQIAIQKLLDDPKTTVPHRRFPTGRPGPLMQSIYCFNSPPWSSVFLHVAGMRSAERIETIARLTRLAERPMAERLYSRDDLGDLLNRHNLIGEGVEVGVADAAFSERIMKQWEGRQLHLVDLWDVDTRNRDHSQVSAMVQQTRQREAKKRMSRFGDRVRFHQADSCLAAQSFSDESLDFVYLDADHSASAVQDDIRAWFPKIRPGGVLAGHDYLDGTAAGCDFGVKTAVAIWECQSGYRVASTAEPAFASWYLFKRPDWRSNGCAGKNCSPPIIS